jgi:hypothetical protein
MEAEEIMVKQAIRAKKTGGGEIPTPREATVKRLKLIDFSGDDNLSPELIDDALNSTTEFYKNINIPEIAAKIKSNKAKYGKPAT